MNAVYYDAIGKAVLRELGDGAISLTGDITRYKQSILRDIAASHQWSWLEEVGLTLSTDSGENYITIPGYLGGEITIYQEESGREIRYVNPQEYARLISITTATSDKPSVYTVRGGRFEFHYLLTTGGSVEVFGTVNADQVDRDNDDAIDGIIKKIPLHFSTLIEWGILGNLDPDNNEKARWQTFYENALNKKRKTDGVTKGRTFVGHKDRAILNSRGYLRG